MIINYCKEIKQIIPVNLLPFSHLFIVGRCKSAYHQFLYDLMDNVQQRAAQRGVKPKTVFLPHCTWDKLGDILANAGGRSMGLFDELLSFFSTMNMYSSVKMQLYEGVSRLLADVHRQG